jgi:hypothetical protein
MGDEDDEEFVDEEQPPVLEDELADDTRVAFSSSLFC